MSDYRWNAATRPAVPGDHVVGICKGGHDSTETPCEYQPITEADVLELVEAVAAAQAEARELRERAEKAERNYQWMVERAADQHLSGYRELARRAADAENVADGLRAELARELCPEVIAFAHLMQHKLNMNAHKDGEGWGRDSSGKRGWKSCSPQFLMDKLYEEVLELTIAIHEGDSAKSIRQEAADVGNIAMMLADVCGALSQPADQHDPLAVSDHCPECSEPEPECVCGEQPAEHESLPLMARREWMRRDTDYFVAHGDFCLEIKAFGRAPHFDESGELVVCAEARYLIERDQVDAEAQLDGIYRIADTDEHGLPVIERTADIPEDVTHMTLHTRRFFRAGELRARSVEGDEGLLRIEDYRPAAQESGDA